MATRYNPTSILAPLQVGEECVNRIESIVQRLAVLMPGRSMSRPDLLRAWITEGIVQAEKDLVAMERQAAKAPTAFVQRNVPMEMVRPKREPPRR